MKYFVILLSILFFTIFLNAQEEDISELEELERELEILESGGNENTTDSNFSERVVEDQIEDQIEDEIEAEANNKVEQKQEEPLVESPAEEDVFAGEEDFNFAEESESPEEFSDFSEGEKDFENFAEESETTEDFSDFDVEDEETFSEVEEVVEEETFGEEPPLVEAETFSEEPPLVEAETFGEEPPLVEEETFNEEPSVVEEVTSPTEESFSSAPISRPDSPNLQKEQQIYNAYQYIRNNAVIGDTWSAISDGRESETYNIQYGDNLWDISLTLFGNPYFWPKIWSLNSSITNPHEIRPGQNLLFIEGSLEQAPVLTDGESLQEENLVREEEAVEEISEEELLANELPSLPKEKLRRPPLKTLPPSLAPWDSTEGVKDDFANESLVARTRSLDQFIEVSTFVTSEAIQGIGKIVEIEGGLNTANLFQYVYIEANGLNAGDQLMVLSNRKPIKRENAEPAFPVVVQGLVEVVESISNEKKIYKALVKKAINPIKLGASVLQQDLPRIRINDLAPVSNIRANIIGAEFDNKRKVFGDGTFIFLDKGKSSGLDLGAKLQIIKNHIARNNTSKLVNSSDVLGIAYVVDVRESLSTAMILQANEYVTVGDTTGDAAILSLGSGSSIEESDFGSELESDLESDFESELESDSDFESDSGFDSESDNSDLESDETSGEDFESDFF